MRSWFAIANNDCEHFYYYTEQGWLGCMVLIWGVTVCSTMLEEANSAVVAQVCGVFLPTEHRVGVALRPIFVGALDMPGIYKLVCLAWNVCFKSRNICVFVWLYFTFSYNIHWQKFLPWRWWLPKKEVLLLLLLLMRWCMIRQAKFQAGTESGFQAGHTLGVVHRSSYCYLYIVWVVMVRVCLRSQPHIGKAIKRI